VVLRGESYSVDLDTEQKWKLATVVHFSLVPLIAVMR
jgi:hypothetical protein